MTKDIIAKIEAGSPLTDGELLMAIKFYEATETNLLLLGLAFSHARRAVTEKLQTLQRFAEARASKA